jgi:flagellar biosynthesis/type III secretory pathway protein FliH
MTTNSDELVEQKKWRCYHCDELFTSERCAREHFGRDEGSTPACIIKGADGGLLRALRDAEEQADNAIQMMHDESTDAAKAYHQQRCRHAQALMAAEEAGYERGLADGRSEAADLILSLQSRVNTLEAWANGPDGVKWYTDRHAEMQSRLSAVEADRDRLREAIEPFATFSDGNVDDDGWSGLEQRQPIHVWFGPSDFRHARASLSVEQDGGE